MDDVYVSYIYLLYSNAEASGDAVKPTKDILCPTFKFKEGTKSDKSVDSSVLVLRLLQ